MEGCAMFRFSIRDLLLVTVIVGLALAWRNDRTKWAAEKIEMMRQRDADVDNERRLGELKAREMAGRVILGPTPKATPRPAISR